MQSLFLFVKAATPAGTMGRLSTTECTYLPTCRYQWPCSKNGLWRVSHCSTTSPAWAASTRRCRPMQANQVDVPAGGMWAGEAVRPTPDAPGKGTRHGDTPLPASKRATPLQALRGWFQARLPARHPSEPLPPPRHATSGSALMTLCASSSDGDQGRVLRGAVGSAIALLPCLKAEKRYESAVVFQWALAVARRAVLLGLCPSDRGAIFLGSPRELRL